MSNEICRRPQALQNFLRLRREEGPSQGHLSFWEGRAMPDFQLGEPISSGQSTIMTERLVYSTGQTKPSLLADKLISAGVPDKFPQDPHALLDSHNSTQAERLSEGLRREREGTLTRRWELYLNHVRAYWAVDHKLAFSEGN